MGLTGLIYAAIVIAWAAYLVPLALRRSQVQSRRNSADRFASAMRVLSRNDDRIGGRTVVTPPRPESPDVAAPPHALDLAPMRRRHRAAARLAAKRRRRVLAALLVATVGLFVGALTTSVASWTPAVPVVVMLAFLVIARIQVRRSERAFHELLDRARPSSSNVVRRVASRVEATSGAVVEADSFSENDLEPDDQPTRLMHLDLADQQVQDAVAIETSDGSNLWDPVAVTLPTYVSKPTAHRQVRTVDLSSENGQSHVHRDDDRAAASAAEDLDDTPRAVGE